MPDKVCLHSLDHLAERERLLLKAVEQRDLAAVQQQLAAGADVSAADDRRLTALHLAAATAQGGMVAALLAAGADVTAKALGGGTPFLYLTSCIQDKTDEVTLLLHSSGGLFVAAHQCDGECSDAAQVMLQLVAAGALEQQLGRDVELGRDVATPLHDAAELGCPTLVAALLAAGADVGSTTPTGYTILHAAASSRSLQVVQQALDALGPSRAAEMVNALGKKERFGHASTPLHLAAEEGRREVVEALVAAGADKDQQDGYKRTALQAALSLVHCHLVPLLVTPSNANGPAGGSPLHLAAAMPPRRSPFSHVQWRQRLVTDAVQGVTTLLAAGADVRAKNSRGHTPLETAARQGHPEVLSVLLEHELHLQQQQQQQQQQVANISRTQLLAPLLRQLGTHILEWPNGRTWRLLLTLAAGAQGEEGVHSLWRDVRKQQLSFEGSKNVANAAAYRMDSVLSTWASCWAAACSDLANQRAAVTGRLEQLVPRPPQDAGHPGQHEQQQQDQGGSADAGPATKRIRQTSRLTPQLDGQRDCLLCEGAAPRQHVGSSSRNSSSSTSGGSSSGSSSISSTAARPDPKGHTAAGHFKELEAIAAYGDETDVQAALALLPDRAAGLSAAAAAAGGAGHWQLCVALHRELVLLEEAKGQYVCLKLEKVVNTAVDKGRWQPETGGDPVSEEEGAAAAGQQKPLQKLRAALQLCDALMADWLALRKQQTRELREAVVAAVTAARK